MIFLGHSLFDRNWLVGVKDDRHQITISSTGGGKGRSVVLPNLLTYPGSVLCVDVKGQNAAVTAERRRAMGQTVHVFDPMNALGGGAALYNPLAELDQNSPDYAEQLDLIVDALVIPGGDKSVFWDESARIVIAGVLDYIIRAPAEELAQTPSEEEGGRVMQKTLGMLRDLLIAVDGPPVDAMAGLGGKALSAAATLSQGSEEVDRQHHGDVSVEHEMAG